MRHANLILLTQSVVDSRTHRITSSCYILCVWLIWCCSKHINTACCRQSQRSNTFCNFWLQHSKCCTHRIASSCNVLCFATHFVLQKYSTWTQRVVDSRNTRIHAAPLDCKIECVAHIEFFQVATNNTTTCSTNNNVFPTDNVLHLLTAASTVLRTRKYF